MKKKIIPRFFELIFDILYGIDMGKSDFYAFLCFLVYFLQTLSPLCRFHYKTFGDSGDAFIFSVIVYSNYFNLLALIQNNEIFLFFVFLILFIETVPLLIIMILAILNSLVPKKSFSILNIILCPLLSSFNYILLIPFLTIFMRSMDCIWGEPTSEFFECDSLMTSYFISVSIFGILYTLILAIILIKANNDYFFSYKTFGIKNNFLAYVINLLRVLPIVLDPLINDKPFFYYIFLHFFGIVSLAEYIYYRSIKKSSLKKKYFAFLLSFEMILLLISIWDFTVLLDNDSIFYFLMILPILAYKFGKNASQNIIDTMFMIDNENLDFFDEHLARLRLDISLERNKLLLHGFFLNHYRRKCNDRECLSLQNEFNESSSNRFADKFIKAKFESLIENKKLKFTEEKTIQIIMKFIDFIFISCKHSMLAFYDYEKSKNKLLNKSFFLRKYFEWLDGKMKAKISKEQNQYELMNENFIDLNDYFKFVKSKTKFETLMREILLKKKEFWTNYLNGSFKTMNHLAINIEELTNKINAFQEKLNKYSFGKTTSKLLALKLNSIFYSLFFNNIDKAIKFESDFESMFNNERIKFERRVNKISIYNKEVVTCEVSFLNLEGVIKSTSKTEKLGSIFGYSKNEIVNLELIDQLMPSYFSKIHKKFIQNFLNGEKPFDLFANKHIQTYGLHKKRYVFPIRLHFGLSQSYEDDFVLISAIVPENKNDQMIIIYSEDGKIIGISSRLMKFFKRKIHENIDFLEEVLEALSIYDIISNLNSLKTNDFDHHIIRNQREILLVPVLNNKKTTELTNQIQSFSVNGKIFEKCKKYNINFDLFFHSYSSINGKDPIKVFKLSIKNISKEQKLKNVQLNIINSQKFLQTKTKSIHDTENSGKKEFLVTENDSESKIKMAPNNLDVNLIRNNNDLSFKSIQEENILITETEEKNPRQKPKSLIALKTLIKDGQINEEIKENNNKSNENEIRTNKSLTKNSQKIVQKKNKEEKDLDSDKGAILTSNKVDTKNIEVFSKHSSALKFKSKNFKVFKSIETIKKYIPTKFYLFFVLISLEIVLAIIFAIIYQTSEYNYFNLKYSPSKVGMINFCRLYTAFSFCTAITLEYEYKKLNLSHNLSFLQNEDEIYYRILNSSFLQGKEIVYSERNSAPLLYYQSIYRNFQTYLINFDYNPKTLQKVSFFSLLDFYLIYVGYIGDIGKNYKSMEYDFLIFLQRNFPYYLTPSAAIFNEIQASFMTYNDETDQHLLSILIIFLIIIFCIKIIETILLYLIHKHLLRIINIFLRTNPKEALREKMFLEQTIEDFKENDEVYFYSSYALKSLEKQNNLKNYIEREQPDQALKAKRQVKTNSFKLNRNMQPLNQKKNLFLILTTFSLSFTFYFFNYYYWLVVNSSVKELISINIAFASIYVYSSSLLSCNNLLIREKIITNNTSYESIANSTYQDSKSRINYLLGALTKRLPIVTEVGNTELPARVFQAEKFITDPNFQQLTKSNICQLLLDLDKIKADEVFLCQNVWNGALTKGILISVTHYHDLLGKLGYLRNNTNDTEKQKKEIYDYLEDDEHATLFFGVYYLNLGLFLFFQYINNYYDFIIDNSIYTLKVILILTTIAFTAFNVLISYSLWRHFKKFFKFLGYSLSLMPYEKITDDEPTYQIINNFLK